MSANKARNSMSIRNSIIIFFIISMLLSVSFIGYLVFSNWASSAIKATEEIAADVSREINHQVSTFLQIPEIVNDVNRKLIENNLIDLNNEIEREKFFVGVLKSYDNYIYSFSIGTAAGEYYGARRNEKGIIEIMRNNAETGGHSWYYSVRDDMTAGELAIKLGKFDPRSREWYTAAVEAGGPVFSPVYKHFVMPDLALTAAWPLYGGDGGLMGVLGTHMVLSGIDDYLKEIVKAKNGLAVIIEKDSGKIIANSLGVDNFTVLEDGSMKRHGLEDLENSLIGQAYENYKNSGSNYLFKTKTDTLYFNFAEYKNKGLNWMIITALPESMLMSDARANIKPTLFLVIVSIIVFLLIYYYITDKLMKPVDRLIEATDRLSSGDLSQRAVVARKDEIGRLSESFNRMADMISTYVNELDQKVRERTEELAKANSALEDYKDRLRLILDSAAEAIYGIDTEGKCIFCNASCIKLLKYGNQDELIGKNMHMMAHYRRRDGSDYPISECSILRAAKEGIGFHSDGEIFWKADGSWFEAEYYSYPINKDNKTIGAVVTLIDITERRKNEEHIRYLSRHDALTGLINRHHFEELLREYDVKSKLPISVIFADINGLKLANDIFGHASGDMLIKKAANILRKNCRENDIVARVGGDEFIILMPNTEAECARVVIKRIRSEISKEKVNDIRCSMALGFDTKTEIYQEMEKVVENAENEMYVEKLASRKQYGIEALTTIMNTIHKRNPGEKMHSEKVSRLCGEIARALGLPETDIIKIKEAGYFHDIGKIVIEEDLLNKSTALTKIEKQKLQQHAVVGYRILNLFDDKLDLADGIYKHHENWNGTGYPKGLKGDEIPLISRIISLAENFDRKMSEIDKPHPEAEKAVLKEICKDAGKKFDPILVNILVGIIGSN